MSVKEGLSSGSTSVSSNHISQIPNPKLGLEEDQVHRTATIKNSFNTANISEMQKLYLSWLLDC